MQLSSNSLSVVSGTKRERGLLVGDRDHLEGSRGNLESEEVYDFPSGISSCLSSQSWVRYVPFCPWKDHRTQYKSEDNNMSQGQGGKQLPNGTEVIDAL